MIDLNVIYQITLVSASAGAALPSHSDFREVNFTTNDLNWCRIGIDFADFAQNEACENRCSELTPHLPRVRPVLIDQLHPDLSPKTKKCTGFCGVSLL